MSFSNQEHYISKDDILQLDELGIYLFHWVVKSTQEIFYVGIGKGDTAFKCHEHAHEAEKIKTLFETEVVIVRTNIPGIFAEDVKLEEIRRLLNETDHRLTNRMIPLGCKRGNGYDRAHSTPKYAYEVASVFYASEIQEHYFKTEYRLFDAVNIKTLSNVYFVQSSASEEEFNVVYGGNFDRYLNDVQKWLTLFNSKIVRSRYAKSVTAWIYMSDDYVSNYELDMEKAKERIGTKIPCYHLIDIWKTLKSLSLTQDGHVTQEKYILKSVYNRVPIDQIKNQSDFNKAFDLGYPLYEKGERLRKAGNITEAIALFDEARSLGYTVFGLYEAYAKSFRKLKQYEDEILIIEEAILKNSRSDKSTEWYLRLERAKELLKKNQVRKN
ncbi:tetratricopeptide repeat protein [Streptococcus suis]|uniref:tetratricopeptide repeat protein n=1 Tax=Streptococcus suis TaxID=1307 RepID=UPI000404685B|nr:hypothetical protein [Streptococcus suis 10581]